MSFPFIHQSESMDCGPACIGMIAAFFGMSYSLPELSVLCGMTEEGVSLLGLSQAAEAIGFRTMAVEVGDGSAAELPVGGEVGLPVGDGAGLPVGGEVGLPAEDAAGLLDAIAREGLLPFIAHWSSRHFLVVYGVSAEQVWIADPARELMVLGRGEFVEQWGSGEDRGIALLLEPVAQVPGE